MHPTLLNSWFCADIQTEANASGVKVKSSDTICDTALVLWTRTVMPTLTNSDGFVSNLLNFVTFFFRHFVEIIILVTNN